VKISHAEAEDTRLAHYTIVGGEGRSGGVYCHDSSPTIDHCIFRDNFASRYGGALYATGRGFVTVTNCIFENNRADENGGALLMATDGVIRDCEFRNNYCPNHGAGLLLECCEDALVEDCLFQGNSAYLGAGLLYEGGSPQINRCSFTENTADWVAALYCFNAPDNSWITDCEFFDNSATFGHGAVGCHDSAPTFTNCSFHDNSAGSQGGGAGAITGSTSQPLFIRCDFDNNFTTDGGGALRVSSPHCYFQTCRFRNNVGELVGGAIRTIGSGCIEMLNCLISGNRSNGHGGAFYLYAAREIFTMSHCTIVGNSAGTNLGGGVYLASFNQLLLGSSSIFWDNEPNSITYGNNSVQLDHSDIEDGLAGEGNIAADPGFGVYQEFHAILLPGSPCIDAGSGEDDGINWDAMLPAYGAVNSQAPDMGAYGGPDAAMWLD
jgi:predicted outer membrane repeat protein